MLELNPSQGDYINTVGLGDITMRVYGRCRMGNLENVKAPLDLRGPDGGLLAWGHEEIPYFGIAIPSDEVYCRLTNNSLDLPRNPEGELRLDYMPQHYYPKEPAVDHSDYIAGDELSMMYAPGPKEDPEIIYSVRYVPETGLYRGEIDDCYYPANSHEFNKQELMTFRYIFSVIPDIFESQ